MDGFVKQNSSNILHLHESVLSGSLQPATTEPGLVSPTSQISSMCPGSGYTQPCSADHGSDTESAFLDNSESHSLGKSLDSIASFTPALLHSHALPSSTLLGLKWSSFSFPSKTNHPTMIDRQNNRRVEDRPAQYKPNKDDNSSLERIFDLDFEDLDLFPHNNTRYTIRSDKDRSESLQLRTCQQSKVRGTSGQHAEHDYW